MTPTQAIRAKCLDCAETAVEVKLCPIDKCPLYPFRFGKNPNIRREYSQERRDAIRKQFAKNVSQAKDGGENTVISPEEKNEAHSDDM